MKQKQDARNQWGLSKSFKILYFTKHATIIYMTKSGLPVAKQIDRSVKIGSIIIKTEKPSESSADFKKAILSLEKAGKENIFNQNEGFQC